MTRVKVCGITNEKDLQTAVAAGADAVGLIASVSAETPRDVAPERAAELSRAAPPFVTTVLVTMPESSTAAVELVERVQSDAVQVHGEFTPADLSALSSSVAASVLRAVAPDDAGAHDDAADALVVDSLDESGAGGTGETHDWARTRDLVGSLSSPVVLAGGLTPENVADAVERVDPFAVDVASGVEAEPGCKEPAAVEAFVREAGDRP